MECEYILVFLQSLFVIGLITVFDEEANRLEITVFVWKSGVK